MKQNKNHSKALTTLLVAFITMAASYIANDAGLILVGIVQIVLMPFMFTYGVRCLRSNALVRGWFNVIIAILISLSFLTGFLIGLLAELS